ncbi:succinylglutamate desuccinylase [Actimicrobium antarcticum]|uniref:Succinylglutamate desuccinylase n=1 Tax=Actimicrobium antarcticum TaxID=1051899 RepID=A0ABP7TST3_9BURK
MTLATRDKLTAVSAFVAGDFSALAAAFAAAGCQVDEPAPGTLQLQRGASGPNVLLSVGIHGDETAPIELVAQLLAELALTPQELGVNLLLVVGNIDAIRQSRRFIDADLNRLFRPDRGALAATAEAARADAIMAATTAFFDSAAGACWHLDLHTAIRASVYPTFAILPASIAAAQQRALTSLLGHAGIAAVIINPTSAGTFSAFTAEQCGATSSTVELGRVSALGANDVSVFAAASRTLSALLRGDVLVHPAMPAPLVFEVVQEIIKHSEAFRMHFDGATQNFTAMQRGDVIATDGEVVYRVGHDEELVVFPNPSVRIGLRAGLMVVRSPDLPES